jgi:hypothetical protein
MPRTGERQGVGQESEMTSTTKRVIGIASLLGFAIAGAPALGSAESARLYEMTENMKITSGGKFERRKATSELIGTADLGTPLCPEALVLAVNPGAESCTINATGSDNVSLHTGLGDFGGTFTVVVQGDNASDSPEFVVMRGSFSGTMDFSPAILAGIPLGSVTGKMRITGARGSIPFRGTFRLPFVLTSPLQVPDGAGGVFEIPCGSPAGCDDTAAGLGFYGPQPPALPLRPWNRNRYNLTNGTRPLFLLDNGMVEPVKAEEFGAGWAAVKFEINF